MIEIEDLVNAAQQRALPLSQIDLRPAPELQELAGISSSTLFPGSRDAVAAHAGLLLLLGGWEQSHHVTQDVGNPNGSFWHGILHRIEPDVSNANYWFRRVGPHPIFPDLLSAASAILEQNQPIAWKLKASWNAALFVQWCDEARNENSKAKRTAAIEMQRAECRLLLDFCRQRPA